MPSNSEWTAVENSEILQPENTVEGDKYIVYIKETKGNDETVDAKFLTCVYKEDAGVDKEEKTITETVKLPVTFDSGADFIYSTRNYNYRISNIRIYKN